MKYTFIVYEIIKHVMFYQLLVFTKLIIFF